MWPPGLPHGILCTRLQYVHIEAWYTGSFEVARIPAGYVLKSQNPKKLSGVHLEKGLKCVQKENGSQKSHKQCMKHTSLIQQKPLIYSFLTLYLRYLLKVRARYELELVPVPGYQAGV